MYILSYISRVSNLIHRIYRNVCLQSFNHVRRRQLTVCPNYSTHPSLHAHTKPICPSSAVEQQWEHHLHMMLHRHRRMHLNSATSEPLNGLLRGLLSNMNALIFGKLMLCDICETNRRLDFR